MMLGAERAVLVSPTKRIDELQIRLYNKEVTRPYILNVSAPID